MLSCMYNCMHVIHLYMCVILYMYNCIHVIRYSYVLYVVNIPHCLSLYTVVHGWFYTWVHPGTSWCYLSVCVSVCLSVCQTFCVSVCMYVCMSVCMSVCLTQLYIIGPVHDYILEANGVVCLSICMSVCLSVCLSVCQTVCVSVCMSVCLTQLYMIGPIRDYILEANGAVDDSIELEEMDDRPEYNDVCLSAFIHYQLLYILSVWYFI